MTEKITTRCCIVGGGPAGAVLGLLLARAGVPVVLLEAHDDFDREFRGDTLHPSAMEILDDLGLAERVLALPHQKVPRFAVSTERGAVPIADFSRLRTPFPFITMVRQDQFLELVTAEAARSPNFHLVMGAHVRELVVTDGVVRGVRYHDRDGWHEVRALLTVGADGRSSTIRRLAGFAPVGTSPPMDVLWFGCRAGLATRSRPAAGSSAGACSSCCTAVTTGRSATCSPRGPTSGCAPAAWTPCAHRSPR
ncbi:MAG: FAD-dependent monooxygenase [Egibacteraceae bacterium]